MKKLILTALVCLSFSANALAMELHCKIETYFDGISSLIVKLKTDEDNKSHRESFFLHNGDQYEIVLNRLLNNQISLSLLNNQPVAAGSIAFDINEVPKEFRFAVGIQNNSTPYSIYISCRN